MTPPDSRPNEAPRPDPETGQDQALNETAPADQQMEVVADRPQHDIAVLRVTGEIDLLTAEALGLRLHGELESDRRAIVLDLSEVSFLGSSGLAEIVAFSEAATDRDVSVCLVAANRAVLRPLEVTGLQSILSVYSTVEEALREHPVDGPSA